MESKNIILCILTVKLTNLEQESCSLILVACDTQHPLRVNDDCLVHRIEGCPDTHCSRRLALGCWENITSTEECVVQRVRFPITRVAKYRYHLYEGIVLTAKLLQKVFFIGYLQHKQNNIAIIFRVMDATIVTKTYKTIFFNVDTVFCQIDEQGAKEEL